MNKPMVDRISYCNRLFQKSLLVVGALIGLALTSSAEGTSWDRSETFQGKVESGGIELAGYKVSLFASFVDHGPPWLLLGSDVSNRAGKFQITYSLPKKLSSDQQPLLFVEAKRGAVMLAAAIGLASNASEEVIINELTTVATGNAFAPVC